MHLILNKSTGKYVQRNGKLGRQIFASKLSTIFLDVDDFTDIRIVNSQGSGVMYNGTCLSDNHTIFYMKAVIKRTPFDPTQPMPIVDPDIMVAFNEVLASVLYNRLYGVSALNLHLIINDSRPDLPRIMVVSQAIDHLDACEDRATSRCRELRSNNHHTVDVMEPFLVDCILANWDVGRRGNIGVVSTGNEVGRAMRIDVGGALLYRARGESKNLTGIPREHKTLMLETNVSSKLFRFCRPGQIPDMFKALGSSSCAKRIRVIAKDLTADIHASQMQDEFKKMCNEVLLTVVHLVIARHAYYMQHRKAVGEEILDALAEIKGL